MVETTFDVVICGGGLAGLALARQLKLETQPISVAVVDRLSAPFPDAAHKVGESSNELGSHYFGNVLGLEANLSERQLRKFSLRYFFGDPHGAFEDRPELGVKASPPLPTYQIDRGRLENDLRKIVTDMGVTLIENASVDDIALSDGSEPHVVTCRRGEGAETFALRGNWVVDALGRRRLLQTKLGLAKANGHAASSSWWRIGRRVDVTDMSNSKRWKNRVVQSRYWSTNHLMGRGYWVWLIPLSSGATSIGIVTDETIHPLSSYGKSYAQSLEWLSQYEPALWRMIKDDEPLDFHRLKNFSYDAAQLFSHQRWSCVGDAGLFLDPLYSVGSDFIAAGNTITTELIRRDREGNLTEAAVADFNRLMLTCLGPHALSYYRDTYRTFGHAHIYTAKLTWDTAIFWSIVCQTYIQDMIKRPSPELFAIFQRYNELHGRVQRLLVDWAEKTPPRSTFVHADLTRMKLHQLLYLDLAARRSPEQFLEIARLNLDRFEELAQVIFWQAVKEALPDHMPDEREMPWIDAWQISLSPERWQEDKLFEPRTAPRNLSRMRDTFAGVFGPMTWGQEFRIELFYRLRHVARGKPMSAMVRVLHRRLIQGKPAMWLRRMFVVDHPSLPATTVASPRAAPLPQSTATR
jgi:flavin-dependent dehydrogenase